jgi:hypothetical protein
MDEAKRMLERLERIELLRAAGGGRQELLAELRALVAEGEAWASAEGAGTRAARAALAELDEALERAVREGAGGAEEVVAAGQPRH